MVRTLLRKVATPPHHGQSILLRKTVCDRPVFFGVHTLRFTGQSILLCKTVYCQNFATKNRLFRTLLRKAVCDRRIMVMTFVNESCLWQPHRLVRSVGQSILLRKTVYCQNFATQNRLQRQRSSLFLTAPFFFGVHTLRFIKGLT